MSTENKLEEDKATGTMEGEVNEDDGTFTNISLTDDTGKGTLLQQPGFFSNLLFIVD